MEKQEITKRYPGLDEKALDIALARHAAVSWIAAEHKQGTTLEACYQRAQEMEWRGRRFGHSTLERYWHWYRDDGFEGLVPTVRADAGKSRALAPDFLKLLEARRREQPLTCVKELLRGLVRAGQLDRFDWATLSSVYRHLKKVGLDAKTLRLQGGHGPGQGPTKAFEVATVNELWMSDVMHGPTLVRKPGEKLSTRLIAVIDDASRLVPYAEYRATEQEEDLWIVLMEAMERRGLPRKLYTDNGKIFTSTRTQATCARLGVRLLHAKPYAAWSKGKVERWFQTVQSQFESRLSQDPVREIAELNRRFWHWLESEYHQREHTALGKSPQTRFLEGKDTIRLLDREKLESCFWQEETRRVRRDATVGWRGQCWEAPVFLRGMKVTLRYNPLKEQDPVQVWHDRRLCGMLHKLDREINSRLFNKSDLYE